MKNYITKPFKTIGKGITMLGLSTLVTLASINCKYSNNIKEYSNNVQDISFGQDIEVENIMKGIKDKNIHSYEDLVKRSRDLSKNQKFILMEKIGKSLVESGSYNRDKTFKELLEDSLKNSSNKY